jgi:hypothetical protein
MRPHPPTNGLPTVENGLPTVCQRPYQRPYQRYADALPTGCVPTPLIPHRRWKPPFRGLLAPLAAPPAQGNSA